MEIFDNVQALSLQLLQSVQSVPCGNTETGVGLNSFGTVV